MNLIELKIEKIIENEKVVLFPTLIQINGRNYLVDCGYEETSEELESKLSALDIELIDLKGVIITHDDYDHIGGLKYLKQKNMNIEIYCGELEKDSLIGKIKSERLVQAELFFESVPEEKNWAMSFIQKLQNIQRFSVDKVFQDNEIFEDDIIVIHTPGHTKGHIALFIPKLNTLIAGDSIVVENGVLNIANPTYTLDMKQAIHSIEKIKQLNPKKIICYHGGIVDEDIVPKLESLISKYINHQ